jgi:predicted RNase H-like nuclease (RuvC/YqgF family)
MATKEKTTLNELYQFVHREAVEKGRCGTEVEKLREQARKLSQRLYREADENPEYLDLLRQIKETEKAGEKKNKEVQVKLKRLWLRIQSGKNPDKVKDELVALAESLLPPESQGGEQPA